MIEFRYLNTHRDDFYRTLEKRELQYRVMQDTTIYAFTPNDSRSRNLEWSKWITVPEVHTY